MKRCKHENSVGYMWRDTAAFLKPPLVKKTWFYAFVQPGDVTHHNRVVCQDCGESLPLGPANDDDERVRVEIRAAELALDPPMVGFGDIHRNDVADCDKCGYACGLGYSGHWEPDGEPREPWLAGYLAAAIAAHKEPNA